MKYNVKRRSRKNVSELASPPCFKSKNGEPSPILSWLKSEKLPTQNITTRLFHREIHLHPRKHMYSYRFFYQSITPNFTVTNIQKPPCFVRKFSPCGKFLIAFSSDQTSVEIYQYCGPTAAEQLLRESICDGSGLKDHKRPYVEKNIFNHFFRLKHSVLVASNREQLNRECSLFTDDGRYIIVGSVSLRNIANLDDNYRNNESVTPNPRSPLDDHTIYIVDIELGMLTDSRTFHHDKIFLSHNQGIYLYEKTLAVLSVQHQTIHVFEINSDGSFVNIRTIGRVCFDDDDFILSSSIQRPTGAPLQRSFSSPDLGLLSRTENFDYYRSLARGFQCRPPLPAYEDGHSTLYSLKHRLLVFLFRYAKQLSAEQGSAKPVLEFYRHFNYFVFLRIWKIQLLDENHLLIKYSSEEVVTLRAAEPNGQQSLIVIYNMVTTEIVGVYENTSDELLSAFERLSDYFRNPRLNCESHFTSSPSNNVWARLGHERHKSIIVSAKGGGAREATKRLLGQLPISAQSFCSSPFLDFDLFSYDDKWVSVLERPKTCTDHPIRFYGRQTGLLKFSITAGRSSYPPGLPTPQRRLVAFTFHPCDPLAISVQRSNDEYIVSLHIRHPGH